MGLKEALKGIAIGDAFGAGIEFQDRRWIIENVDFTRYMSARIGIYAENYEPGFYTDDTEHSIGVLKALMHKEIFSEELLLRLWKEEYENDKKAKGFPRQGHGSIKQWYEGNISIESLRESQRKREYPGNAPAMRGIPIGFAPHDKINPYAFINANATHPHPKAQAASILIARAAEYMIVKEGKQDEVIPYCSFFIEDKETIRLLNKIQRLPCRNRLNEKDLELLCGPQPIPYYTEKGKELYGMPCDAMRTAAAALYIIKNVKDPFEGLKRAIRLGGDVDSVAAITTGILAGRYGLDSIPKNIIQKTEGLEKLEALGELFYNN
jgi:ADP-ribosylglycohydrolase